MPEFKIQGMVGGNPVKSIESDHLIQGNQIFNKWRYVVIKFTQIDIDRDLKRHFKAMGLERNEAPFPADVGRVSFRHYYTQAAQFSKAVLSGDINEQDKIRQHINIFVNNIRISDISYNVNPLDEVYIVQALSGG